MAIEMKGAAYGSAEESPRLFVGRVWDHVRGAISTGRDWGEFLLWLAKEHEITEAVIEVALVRMDDNEFLRYVKLAEEFIRVLKEEREEYERQQDTNEIQVEFRIDPVDEEETEDI